MSIVWSTVQNAGPGKSAFDYSQLASIVFNDQLYLFYNGSADDGIWYTTYNDTQWSGMISVKNAGATNMYLADYTSPSPVVLNGKIYLFYNGRGNNGTFYTTSSDGVTWTQVASIFPSGVSETFATKTSPTSAVLEGKIYIFWNPNTGESLRMSTFDGTNFSTPITVPVPVGIRAQTSAAAVVFNDMLWLFYNGSGQDGTWFTTFQTNNQWSPVAAVSATAGTISYLDGTSPAAFVNEANQLIVMWNGSLNDGVWTSVSADGLSWLPQVSVKKVVPGQNLLLKSSPCGISYRSNPFVFYIGTEKALYYTQGAEPGAIDASAFPTPLALGAQNLALKGSILTGTVTSGGKQSTAEYTLDLVFGNLDGKFQYGFKNFSSTAKNLQLTGTVLSAQLEQNDGSWSSASVDLAEKIAVKDGKFWAEEVPVVVPIPNTEAAIAVATDQLGRLLDSNPALEIAAIDNGNGTTTFVVAEDLSYFSGWSNHSEDDPAAKIGYVSAGIDIQGLNEAAIFKSISAEAQAAVFHVASNKGSKIQQFSADVLSVNVGAGAQYVGAGAAGIVTWAGVDASVNLVDLEASIFDLNLGVGVSTDIGYKDYSVGAHLAGCGITIGKKTSISVFDNSFGIDFGRLFD